MVEITEVQCGRQNEHSLPAKRINGEAGEIAGTPLTMGFGSLLSQSGEVCEWRDRRDSNPRPPA